MKDLSTEACGAKAEYNARKFSGRGAISGLSSKSQSSVTSLCGSGSRIVAGTRGIKDSAVTGGKKPEFT